MVVVIPDVEGREDGRSDPGTRKRAEVPALTASLQWHPASRLLDRVSRVTASFKCSGHVSVETSMSRPLTANARTLDF